MFKEALATTVTELEKKGAVLIPDVFDEALLQALGRDMNAAFQRTFEVQNRNAVGRQKEGQATELGGDGSLLGAAHHIVTYGHSFFQLLEEKPCFQVIAEFLGGKFILNSFGAVNNVKSQSMYEHGKTIHRDTRSFHSSFRQSLWMLVMLDDFTVENGATYILPGSQTREEAPSEAEFFRDSIRAVGRAGSVALWDGRVWHAAGTNRTDQPRRALTISFTRPFVKPQLDYVRHFGEAQVLQMSENLQQLFGLHSRVPVTLEDWYQTPERRFYKSNQG